MSFNVTALGTQMFQSFLGMTPIEISDVSQKISAVASWIFSQTTDAVFSITSRDVAIATAALGAGAYLMHRFKTQNMRELKGVEEFAGGLDKVEAVNGDLGDPTEHGELPIDEIPSCDYETQLEKYGKNIEIAPGHNVLTQRKQELTRLVQRIYILISLAYYHSNNRLEVGVEKYNPPFNETDIEGMIEQGVGVLTDLDLINARIEEIKELEKPLGKELIYQKTWLLDSEARLTYANKEVQVPGFITDEFSNYKMQLEFEQNPVEKAKEKLKALMNEAYEKISHLPQNEYADTDFKSVLDELVDPLWDLSAINGLISVINGLIVKINMGGGDSSKLQDSALSLLKELGTFKQ